MSHYRTIDKSDSLRSRIWQLCCERHLTFAELATLAGVHRSTIWNWLKGTTRPSQKSLVKLYKVGLRPTVEDM
jgi:transcriptional regulator with XRE-family HTH domain